MLGGVPVPAAHVPPGRDGMDSAEAARWGYGKEAASIDDTALSAPRAPFAVQSAFVTEPELRRDMMHSDYAHQTLSAPAYGDSNLLVGTADQGTTANQAGFATAARAPSRSEGAVVAPAANTTARCAAASAKESTTRAETPAAGATDDKWVLHNAMKEAERCRRERKEAREERRRMAALTMTIAALVSDRRRVSGRQGRRRRLKRHHYRRRDYSNDESDSDDGEDYGSSEDELLESQLRARHASRRARRALRHCKDLERELDAHDIREARRRRRRRLQIASFKEASPEARQKTRVHGERLSDAAAVGTKGASDAASAHLYRARDVWLLVLATLLVVAAVVLMIAGAVRLFGARRRERCARQLDAPSYLPSRGVAAYAPRHAELGAEDVYAGMAGNAGGGASAAASAGMSQHRTHGAHSVAWPNKPPHSYLRMPHYAVCIPHEASVPETGCGPALGPFHQCPVVASPHQQQPSAPTVPACAATCARADASCAAGSSWVEDLLHSARAGTSVGTGAEIVPGPAAGAGAPPITT